MGITGLLPFLDKVSEKINVKSLANRTVAIDSYCWLHKGAFAVGDKLARGEPTDVHILYCLKYVNMLLAHNIKPILVFDGRHLPAKADTEAKRRETRKIAKQRAIELMRKGQHNEARNYLRRCVDVTHEMALQLIQACRAINVDCIVAPYEADGQLAYLNKIGIADYVVTEDSDLILFGSKRILFKLDLMGSCVMINADKLHLAMGCPSDKFTMEKFRYMCIISGCDYVESLPGIGLIKACKFMLKTEETDMTRALDKIPAYLNMRHLNVTDEYKMSVLRANATFQHMVVYDPRKRKQVRLYDPDEIGTQIELCCNAGILIDDDTALNLAVGNLNPFSMKQLDDWHPDNVKIPKTSKTNKKSMHLSIWQNNFVSGSKATNGKLQQTSILKSINKSNSLSNIRQTRRSLAAINSDEDERLSLSPGKDNGDDLLNEYTKERQPPQKRFKEDTKGAIENNQNETEDTIESIDQLSLKITPNRNPFKKERNINEELLSPTKITKENCSLIKNQSPVKQIDFKKLEKLSKFNRTVISNKQNVISRFFGNSTHTIAVKQESKIKTNNELVEETSGSDSQDELEGKIDELEQTIKQSHYLCSDECDADDNAISLNGEKSCELSQNNILNSQETPDQSSQEYAISSDNVEELNLDDSDNDSKDQPIVVSDDDSTASIFTQSRSQISKSLINGKTLTNTKPLCRKPGLSRRKSTKKLNEKSEDNTIQSRLSMFGFQKRPQAL